MAETSERAWKSFSLSYIIKQWEPLHGTARTPPWFRALLKTQKGPCSSEKEQLAFPIKILLFKGYTRRLNFQGGVWNWLKTLTSKLPSLQKMKKFPLSSFRNLQKWRNQKRTRKTSGKVNFILFFFWQVVIFLKLRVFRNQASPTQKLATTCNKIKKD